MPVSGTCLLFKLFDYRSGGTQIGPQIPLSNQTLTEGLFVGTLDFGFGVFNGQAARNPVTHLLPMSCHG